MKQVELRDWVGGHALPVLQSSRIQLHDPNSGRPDEPMAYTDARRIEDALTCAHDIHQSRTWAYAEPNLRARALEQIAGALEARIEEIGLVAAERTGVVIAQTRRFASLLPIIFKAASTIAREMTMKTVSGANGPVEIHRLPIGPALCISPWNAPTVIAAHKVASALAVGCPVILKPSEWAPHTANILAEAIYESDLPAGVFQLLHGDGDVGAALTADERIRAVSFTGGLAGGRAVAMSCAQQIKPAQLELGGNNPLVVLKDADMELASDGVVSALTLMNAQWCRALGRILVHESRANELLDAVAEKLSALQMGPSTAETSDMGPLIHAQHFDTIHKGQAALVSAGGTAHSWTNIPAGDGYFYPPTIVTGCEPKDTVGEIFGPVAALHTFGEEEEMFSLVHQAPYGLASYIFGDETRAMHWARRFEIGATKVNGVTVTSLNPHAPRAAWRLSGLGIEGHRETANFFCGIGVAGIAGGRR